MARIRFGTAGWSYEDWKTTVYPAARGARFDPLAFLSGYFDLVEVNVTFYRLPRPEIVASWLHRTADRPDFRFLLKAPSAWSHPRRAGSPVPAAEFRTIADILAQADRLAGVLLQFPWSCRDEGKTRARIEALLQELEGYPVAVEVRHGSFGRGDWLEWLRSRGTWPVNVDQPLIGDSLALSAASSSIGAYFRLHGRNRDSWFDDAADRDQRYDYLYDRDELEEIAARIRAAAVETAEIFVVTNNHFRGQAAVNALQLRALLEERRVAVPKSLLQRYPALAVIALPEAEAQGELF